MILGVEEVDVDWIVVSNGVLVIVLVSIVVEFVIVNVTEVLVVIVCVV